MKTQFIICLLLGLVSFNAFGVNTINKDVDNFKEGLQSKIEADIKNFLGEESEFDVIVSASLASEVKVNEVTSYDIGYLPRPFQKEEKDQEGLKIQNLGVKVYVYSKIDEPSLKFIKTLVQNHAQGFRANITTEKIVRSIVKEAAPKVVEASWWQKFTANPDNVLKVFVYVLGFVSLLVFLIWFKSFATGAGGSTLNSLKQIASDFKPNPTKLIDRKEEIAARNNEDKFYQSLFERNISIIQKTNLEIPDCLESCIKLNDLKDLKGLRSLIPYLGNESHVHIRYNITSELSSALLNLKDENPLSSRDFYQWVNNFTERLSVFKIKSATLFERLLAPELMSNLKNIPESELLEAAKKLNQPMVWKIIFEILPQERSQFLVAQLDEKDMQVIFKKENLKKSEIIKLAQQLLITCTNLDTFSSEKMDLGILRPIMSILESKKPGEDDKYLESLSEYSAEIIPLVQANIWTAKMIREVPEEVLRQKFTLLEIDQKSGLILGFKDLFGEMFLEFVQDPKLKVILSDKFKSSEKVSPEVTKEAYRTCRSFLTELKRDHDQGMYELNKVA
jgi:hypothetical protein